MRAHFTGETPSSTNQAGACSGTATDVAFFPIDTLKTRLQAPGGFFRNGAWKGIYRGLGSAVVALAPLASLFFVTYDTLKRHLKPILEDSGAPAALGHMAAAIAGEISACLVRVPAEVVKQRAQAQHFSGSWGAFRHILDNKSGEGVFRGLYRGWRITVFREIPFTMIQFPLYEWMKSKIDGGAVELSVCGSIAGGIAAAVTTPLDVLKTRVMLKEGAVRVTECAREVYHAGGWKGFFAGVGPRTMWISAGGAIFLGVYEAVSGALAVL